MLLFDEFKAEVETWNLKHFKPEELMYLGGDHFNENSKGFRLNQPPPRELWWNIQVAIFQLDELREAFGAPVRLLSLYRFKDYNAAIGGAQNSQHLQFTATDFRCEAGTSRDWFEWLNERRKAGIWVGGLGYYPSFVHIDGRGLNATWGHKTK